MIFFCLPGARNKHSCIPSVLSFPSNLQTGHKGFSVPSLNHISHSDVLPVWGSISYFHLVLSFPVWASKFVYFQVSHIFLFLNCFSLRDNLHVSRSFFLLLPLCYVPHIIHHLHFYLFLFQLLFLNLRPPFPLLDSPVPIEMLFDQTSSPYSLLKATEETFPTRMEQKGQNRNRTERWQTESGKGTFSHVNNFPTQPLTQMSSPLFHLACLPSTSALSNSQSWGF